MPIWPIRNILSLSSPYPPASSISFFVRKVLIKSEPFIDGGTRTAVTVFEATS
ncbi:MAG: hypothetical protein CM1200mP37_3030 [Chloroflexota bacterium]|nr:MAG: hypothetical protein CM1200mP37_3030 [Chloroflexota bacterium]